MAGPESHKPQDSKHEQQIMQELLKGEGKDTHAHAENLAKKMQKFATNGGKKGEMLAAIKGKRDAKVDNALNKARKAVESTVNKNEVDVLAGPGLIVSLQDAMQHFTKTNLLKKFLRDHKGEKWSKGVNRQFAEMVLNQNSDNKDTKLTDEQISYAILNLQKELNLSPKDRDGKIGPNTIRAIIKGNNASAKRRKRRLDIAV